MQELVPGHVPAPLGRRVDSVVVQDPLHRGPGDSVAEVRERAADPRVAPPRIVDRHPAHELGDVLSGHWSTSTSAGAALVFLGDQSPVPTQDRIRGDDARDLRQDPPAEFVTAHSESTTLGVRQAKRPRAQVFSEDPILLPEIVDQIVLVTVHPASEREDEELPRRRHSLRLLGRLDQHRPSLGRFFAPYDIQPRVADRSTRVSLTGAPCGLSLLLFLHFTKTRMGVKAPDKALRATLGCATVSGSRRGRARTDHARRDRSWASRLLTPGDSWTEADDEPDDPGTRMEKTA